MERDRMLCSLKFVHRERHRRRGRSGDRGGATIEHHDHQVEPRECVWRTVNCLHVRCHARVCGLLITANEIGFEGATAIAEALELNSSIARIDLGGKCLFCQRVLCGRASLEFAGRGRDDRQLHW